jgi:cell division septation protein DedD
MVNSPPSESAPSAKQLVFLAIMATVVAVIVFLCGVLVGRGVPLRRAQEATASDVFPGGSAQIAGGESESPVAEGGDTSSALADLSYFERLNGTDPVQEADGLQQEDPAESAAEGTVIGGTSAAYTVPETAAPPAASSAVAEVDPEPTAPTFVLQVTALRERDQADLVADGLVASGYPAFVVDPADDAPVVVFRVRVGPYEDRAEAEAAGRRLEAEERLRPWVIQL